jgi:hypothetical protein
VRFHRLPRAREYMGSFWLPPLPGRDKDRSEEESGERHAKRDTATGRFTKLTKKQRRKARGRERAKAALRRGSEYGDPPRRMTCYSATCFECGKVWLSAIRPIKANAERDGRRVYLCGNCR